MNKGASELGKLAAEARGYAAQVREYEPCRLCDGKGKRRVRNRNIYEMWTCCDCNGSGLREVRHIVMSATKAVDELRVAIERGDFA